MHNAVLQFVFYKDFGPCLEHGIVTAKSASYPTHLCRVKVRAETRCGSAFLHSGIWWNEMKTFLALDHPKPGSSVQANSLSDEKKNSQKKH